MLIEPDNTRELQIPSSVGPISIDVGVYVVRENEPLRLLGEEPDRATPVTEKTVEYTIVMTTQLQEPFTIGLRGDPEEKLFLIPYLARRPLPEC